MSRAELHEQVMESRQICDMRNTEIEKWYAEEDEESGDQSLAPARTAFEEAIELFNLSLTGDPRKREFLKGVTNLEHVEKAVLNAKEAYEHRKGSSKAREWLSKFAKRVKFYSGIMDVLMEHHPEYVALAWGAMKFLFVGVLNQENLISDLAAGLCQIADALPRMELASHLYRTKLMKNAVATLYAHIIKFFLRALDWYQKSKLVHAIQSITRPSELRYRDLLEDIAICSRHVENLALAGSQAEQRAMYRTIQNLQAKQRDSEILLLEMRQMMITHQSLNFNTLLDTNRRVTDLQLSQILKFASSLSELDPVRSLQYCSFLRNRRKLKPLKVIDAFWESPKLQGWATSRDSSLIMVNGSFKKRVEIRDFTVNMIELLQSEDIPILWILKSGDQGYVQEPSAIDLLKCLVSQAMRINVRLHNESSLSASWLKYQTATSEDEWITLLGSLITGLPQLYVVIDIENLGRAFADSNNGFSWPSSFLTLFRDLIDRGSETVVKVIFISYGSGMFASHSQEDLRDLVVNVGRTRTSMSAQRRKAASDRKANSFTNATRGRGRGSLSRKLPIAAIKMRDSSRS